MPSYRVQVNKTFTLAATATACASAMDATLAAQGFAERTVVSGGGLVATALVPSVATEAAAKTLSDALIAGWNRTGRSGEASLVKVS